MESPRTWDDANKLLRKAQLLRDEADALDRVVAVALPRLRADAGVSQTALGAAMSSSQAYVSQLEAGKSVSPSGVVRALAAIPVAASARADLARIRRET